MATGTRKITIEILGDAKGFSRSSEEAQGSLKKMESSLGGIGKSIAGAFTVGAVVAFGKASVEAALDDERAQASLAQTLRNTVGATDDQVAAVEKSIAAMQSQFAVADDELRPAFENLVRKTNDVGRANELMSLALDVSAGSGRDLQSVSLALVKAMDGSARGLRDLGIEVKTASGDTASFADIQRQLSDLFQGQARVAAESQAGRMKALQIRFQELQETIGMELLPTLTALADSLGTILDRAQPVVRVIGLLARGIPDADQATKDWTESWSLGLPVIEQTFKILDKGLTAMRGGEIGDNSGGLFLEMNQHLHQVEAAATATASATAGIAPEIEAASVATSDWEAAFANLALGMAARNIAEMTGAAMAAEAAIRKVDRAWDALTGSLSDDNALLDVQDAFDNLTDTTFPATEQGLRDQKRALNDTKLAVADYAKEILGLPPEQVTKFVAEIDEGHYFTVEQQLALLARNRTMNIDIQTRGGIGYTGRKDQTKPRASGGPVWAGSSYVVGERGPELFVPSTSGAILPNSGMTGAAPITIIVQGSVVSENRLIDVVHRGLQRKRDREADLRLAAR